MSELEKLETQAQARHKARDPSEDARNGSHPSHTAPEEAGAPEGVTLHPHSSAHLEAGPERTEEPVILVVEDDEPIAEAMALLLEEAGYRVVWVPNGLEALDAARRQWPSLVLTDLMMPRMGGETLIQALRTLAGAAHRQMPPMVLVTATDITAHQAEMLGVAAVVRKPFDIRDVEALVRRLVAGLPTQ